MERSIPEGLTVMRFEEAQRRRLRTSNMCENLNRQIKPRTRVIGLFPNENSVLRLVSAILMETSEEWETGKVYLTLTPQNCISNTKQPLEISLQIHPENLYRKKVARPPPQIANRSNPPPQGSIFRDFQASPVTAFSSNLVGQFVRRKQGVREVVDTFDLSLCRFASDVCRPQQTGRSRQRSLRKKL
jgi:hypothetical protein